MHAITMRKYNGKELINALKNRNGMDSMSKRITSAPIPAKAMDIQSNATKTNILIVLLLKKFISPLYDYKYNHRFLSFMYLLDNLTLKLKLKLVLDI